MRLRSLSARLLEPTICIGILHPSRHQLFMAYHLLADLIVILHLSFVLFVLFGGLFVLRWPRLIGLHLPAVAWGVIVEFTGWICPLTPLENWLRTQGGEASYAGDFILRYFVPLLYPEGLTHTIQIVLGTLVLAINGAVYGLLWRRRGKSTP